MNSKSETGEPKTPEKLAADITRLMDEAEQMLSDSTSHHAEEKIELLRARFRNAQERLTEIYGDAKRSFINGARHTDETIRTHPYESMAVALGLGLVVGAVLGRRTAAH